MLGTRQPAIARLESGNANVRLTTLVELAKALNTVVRVDLTPVEMNTSLLAAPRWWEYENLFMPVSAEGFESLQFFQEDAHRDAIVVVAEGKRLAAKTMTNDHPNNNLALGA